MSKADLAARAEGEGYILVDLDRTLAHYEGWNVQGNEIGAPIPAMVERVVRWLKMGRDVRIFTARAASGHVQDIEAVRGWCKEHIGAELPVQNWKDYHCVAIWDDLAVTVEPNTGYRWTADLVATDDPLEYEDEAELSDLSVKSIEEAAWEAILASTGS